MKLYELNEGDVFYTSFKYSLNGTAAKCDTFICIRHYISNNGIRKTKCLALNYKNPEVKYFSSNKEVYIKPQ